MTNCSDMLPHLAVYADGELAPELRASVEAHLAECQRCRAEVERWRALRGCVRRAVTSEALPVGLEQRLRQRLLIQPRVTRGLLAFASTSLAAAAVIVVAVSLYLPGDVEGAAVDVSAEHFAQVYHQCALGKHHDSHDCRGMSAAEARKFLARELGFKPLVADLSAHGYVLDGACECFPIHDHGLRVIHVHYRHETTQTQVVSLFSADHRIRLQGGSRQQDHRHPERSYDLAQDGQVNVLKWDEQHCSIVLCGQIEPDELLKLAGSADFAQFLRELPGSEQDSDR
jgi:anti-sigma factor (TIGR02949 family)